MSVPLLLGTTLLLLNAATLIGVLWACHKKIERPPYKFREDITMGPDKGSILRGTTIPDYAPRNFDELFRKPFVTEHNVYDYSDHVKNVMTARTKKDKKVNLNSLQKEVLAPPRKRKFYKQSIERESEEDNEKVVASKIKEKS